MISCTGINTFYDSYRNLCTTHIAAAYEGPGKTTVTFISKEIGQRLLVSNCDQVRLICIISFLKTKIYRLLLLSIKHCMFKMSF